MEGDGQQRPLSAPSLPGRGFLNGAPILVAQKVCVSVYKGITTGEIGGLAADIAAAMTTSHPDYASLAARIAVSNLHKNTLTSFSATIGGASPPRSPQPWFADRKASLRRTPFPSPGDSSTSSSAASTSMSTRSQKVKDTLENVFPSEKELMMPRLPHLLLFYYSTHHYVHLIALLDPKCQSSKAWV